VHWAETDYSLDARQHSVLPEGKGKGRGKVLSSVLIMLGLTLELGEGLVDCTCLT